MAKVDKELESYRNLMEVPDVFEEGFSWSSVVGAVFLAIVMIPGAIYMDLLAGVGVGPAAQWVTVILFIEIAKRANQKLSRAQIFILFYISGAVMNTHISHNLLFMQFYIQSDAASAYGIAHLLPNWFAPGDPDVLAQRSFFHSAWLPAIGLFVFKQFFHRLDTTILGYGLFRVTSDYEKLPFPMAPIGAQGLMALADDLEGTVDKKGAWRWRVFSIGGAIGMIFGAIYLGIPSLTGAFTGETKEVLPIPFADWSQYTEGYLPAVATGISFDLANIIFGMVMPFYAMVGSFIGLVVTFILNPLLFKFNQLPSWESGQQTLEINFNNTVDFYFSFSIGIALAVAIVGFWGMFKSSKIKRSDLEDKELEEKMAQRGDIPNKWILITYFASSIIYITLCGYLIEWHTGVMIVLFFFAFLYTPIISYVTARLEGLCGQVVEIPFIREVTFILSGYNGVAVWFIPTPKGNYGAQTVFYKQAELTGTKFTSIWKADVVLFPIIIISVVGFSSFIWSLADIPSYVYPYAQEMWEFEAKNQSIIYSSTLGEYSIFQDALSPIKIFFGFVAGLVSFIGLALVGSPTLLCYGIVRGLNQTMPHAVIPQFLGALLGRYYFEKKFGLKFRQYAPVLSAGYFCGAGLVAMLCIGFVFLAKSASSLLY